MQSRRAFLKTILSLGALTLPWTVFPSRLSEAVETWLGQPTVNVNLPLQQFKPEISEESLNRTAMDDIIVLASPEMQGRRAGTPGEEQAAAYLAKQLSMLGLEPVGDGEGSFTQVFTIPPVREAVINGRLTFIQDIQRGLQTPSANILGSLAGDSDEVVLISAHYDHLGIYQGKVYPGANDNASGVGCLLDVVRRYLREGTKLKRSLVVAFWSAEEMGFVGSHYFTLHPTFPLNKIKAVINVDTVGNGMIGDFALWADGNNIAVQAVKAAAAAAKASALLTPGQGHNSDQLSFAEVNIPAVTLMARDWLDNNHTPDDTVGFIKPEQVELASDIVYRAVNRLTVI